MGQTGKAGSAKVIEGEYDVEEYMRKPDEFGFERRSAVVTCKLQITRS